MFSKLATKFIATVWHNVTLLVFPLDSTVLHVKKPVKYLYWHSWKLN